MRPPVPRETVRSGCRRTRASEEAMPQTHTGWRALRTMWRPSAPRVRQDRHFGAQRRRTAVAMILEAHAEMLQRCQIGSDLHRMNHHAPGFLVAAVQVADEVQAPCRTRA